MKRLIAIVGLSLAAASASAAQYGAPYEQRNVDRALPQSEFAPVSAYVADSRAPFEQLAIDRALPNVRIPGVQYAAAGGTMSDATDAGEPVWAQDHNFVSPSL